jgi:citrate lyase subunit beta/citryl-CoA lyase
VVLDLEDSVPPALKKEVRGMAREGISILHEFGIPAFVRINSWLDGGAEDVLAVATAGFCGVLLPKSRTVSELRELDATLSYAEGAAGLPFGSIAIMPLPETAEGLHGARDLAAASKRCHGIVGVVGGPSSGDVAGAMGFRPTLEGTEQLYLASKMVLDSRAGGAAYPMASIIGTSIEDHDAVATLVRRAKSLGFEGALLIHPSHVRIANEVFAPTPEEIEYFRGLIDIMQEAERRGIGAVRYRGLMVDYAMLPLARDTLREAERRGMRCSGSVLRSENEPHRDGAAQ